MPFFPALFCPGSNINLYDVVEGLQALGFPGPCIVLEQGKRHPCAEPWQLPGRARLRLTTEAGAPTLAALDTKEKVLRALGKIVPRLESRRLRNEYNARRNMEIFEAQRREHAKRTGQLLLPAPAAGGGGGGGGGGRR
jgi:hypothetical protein